MPAPPAPLTSREVHPSDRSASHGQPARSRRRTRSPGAADDAREHRTVAGLDAEQERSGLIANCLTLIAPQSRVRRLWGASAHRAEDPAMSGMSCRRRHQRRQQPYPASRLVRRQPDCGSPGLVGDHVRHHGGRGRARMRRTGAPSAARSTDRSAAGAWWLQNRDLQELFATELEKAIEILALLPGAGTPWAASPLKSCRFAT
jgi:hypothetical protein